MLEGLLELDRSSPTARSRAADRHLRDPGVRLRRQGRAARLAREIWTTSWRAGSSGEAAELRRRFHEDFWMADGGYYALALDGDKRQVDSLTSNMGHLLWSGIVDPEPAASSFVI